jgi:hypothetical protein
LERVARKLREEMLGDEQLAEYIDVVERFVKRKRTEVGSAA